MANQKDDRFTFSRPLNILLAIIIFSMIMAFYDWNCNLSVLKYSKPLLTSLTALYILIGFASGAIISIIASIIIPFFNIKPIISLKRFYVYYFFSKFLLLSLVAIVVAESIFVFSGPTPGERFFFPQKNVTKTKKNLIIISVDSLRPSNLECYGYTRVTAPFIDTVAKNGILFKNCVSQSSNALSSYASIFTSKYPFEHKVNNSPNGIRSPECPDIKANPLSDEEKTLADILSEKGYLTAAFISNNCLNTNSKLNKGFDFYNDNFPPFITPYINKLSFLNCFTSIGFIRTENAIRIINKILIPLVNKLYSESFGLPPSIEIPGGKKAEEINAVVFNWLHSYGEYNFFLFINYVDPSYPYDAPEPYTRKFASSNKSNITGYTDKKETKDLSNEDIKSLINLYDGEISYVSSQIEELFEKLELLRIRNNTIVVITSPYGEAFGEHGFLGHERTVYEEAIRTPLIIWAPDTIKQPAIINQYVESIDVMPTVLELLDVKSDKLLSGESLLPLIYNTAPNSAKEFTLSQVTKNDLLTKYDYHYNISSIALRADGWKYILNSPGSDELYDLSKDQSESFNLSLKEIKMTEFLKSQTKLITEGNKKNILPIEDKELLILPGL